MITLFYSPGACSLAAHLMLEESGAGFETIRVSVAEGAQLQPAYRAINPRGRVPALQDGEIVITENLAILTYVGHRFPQAGLLPRENPLDLARIEEVLAFSASTVHPAFAQIWRTERFVDEPSAHAAVQANGRRRLLGFFDEIEAMATRGDWFVGGRLSAADFYPFLFYRWGGRIGVEMHGYPAWSAHAARMLARPAVQRVLEREGLKASEFAAAA